MRITLVAAAAAALLAAAPVAAQTVTIGPGASQEPGEVAFYDPDLGPRRGQTFAVPVGAPVLQEFRWFFGTFNQQDAVDPSFTFEVFRWDGSAPVGAALVTRSLPFLVNPGDPPVFTGALALLEEQSYVALLSGTADAFPIPATFGAGEDPYADGTFVYFDGMTWQTQLGREGATDTFFEATFGTSTVPEPGTGALLATGLAGVAAIARRRAR